MITWATRRAIWAIEFTVWATEKTVAQVVKILAQVVSRVRATVISAAQPPFQGPQTVKRS